MTKRLLLAIALLWAFAAQATVYSLPWGPKPQFVDANGAPMSSGTVTFYAAGSTTPQSTYTDSTGGVANSNPITLNTRGESPNEVWFTGGQTYKVVLKDSSGVTVWTVDNVSGVNDIAISNAPSEWIAGPTPTYVSATQFTLAGDQTVTFTVGRRVRTTNSGGTVYSTISASVFGAVTTITIVNDASTLDSGLSAVSYGMLAASNQSSPPATDIYPQFLNNADKTKQVKLSLASITTGTTRTLTVPDQSFTIGTEVGINATTRLGKMSVTTASASGTYTADQVLVQTALSGFSQRLNSYSQVINLATTGAGGMDTGTAPISGFVSVYAIAKSDGTTSILACAVGTSAGSIYGGANMPSGYTYSGLLAIWPTNGSSQFKAGFLLDRKFSYQAAVSIFTGQTGSATPASQSLSAAVPTVARTADVIMGNTTTTGNWFPGVASDSTGTNVALYQAPNNGSSTASGFGLTGSGFVTFTKIPLITAQTIYWVEASIKTTNFMNVTAYEF